MKFDNYKFRCSGLHNLMVSPRSKKELLSETTKSYLKELWIKEIFGREKYVTSKFMEKGTIVEMDSIRLFKEATGEVLFKNNDELSNAYITGTPDIIEDSEVIDFKSSWDIWTFGNVTQEKALKDYSAQLQGYMWLTGKSTSRLVYALVNTPEHIITYELYKMTMAGLIGEDEAEQKKARRNFEFDDIPAVLKIKPFVINADLEFRKVLTERILAARNYMNNLYL